MSPFLVCDLLEPDGGFAGHDPLRLRVVLTHGRCIRVVPLMQPLLDERLRPQNSRDVQTIEPIDELRPDPCVEIFSVGGIPEDLAVKEAYAKSDGAVKYNVAETRT